MKWQAILAPIALVCAASLLTSMDGAPFPLLTTAVFISAWHFGTLSGILAFCLSMVVVALWIFPATGLADSRKYLGFVVFVAYLLFTLRKMRKAEGKLPQINGQLAQLVHKLTTSVTALIGYAELGSTPDRERNIAIATHEAKTYMQQLAHFVKAHEK